MRWHKRYSQDAIYGTTALTLEEKGALITLLDHIYLNDNPIPDDDRWLAGLCTVSIRKWKALKKRLSDLGIIYIENGKISNHRADIEIEKARQQTQKLAENGAKGGEKRAKLTEKRRKMAENGTASNKNNDLAQAPLKLIDKNRIDKNTPSIPQETEPPDREPARPDEEEKIIDFEFEKFWQAFPEGRKHDKLKTRRKYRRILSGRDPDLTATAAEIKRGAELYASKMLGREHRFVKRPINWLSNACWQEVDAGAPPDFTKKSDEAKDPNSWGIELAKSILEREGVAT